MCGGGDGGNIPPRRTEIKGQDHILSYITPEEGEVLKALGGAGKPGPMGIPSFYGPGGPGDDGTDPGDSGTGGDNESNDNNDGTDTNQSSNNDSPSSNNDNSYSNTDFSDFSNYSSVDSPTSNNDTSSTGKGLTNITNVGPNSNLSYSPQFSADQAVSRGLDPSTVMSAADFSQTTQGQGGSSVSVSDVAPGLMGTVTGTVNSKGFSSITSSLMDEDFGQLSPMGNTQVSGLGYDNSGKIDDTNMSWGPNGFGPPSLDPFGGRGADLSMDDALSTSGASIGGSLFGGGQVTTSKADLDIATIAPGYGRDFGMNLGSFMNNPNMAGVTPTQSMSTDTYSPYSGWGAKIGGQAPTYGVSLADYGFNKNGTVTASFSGLNQGFFGSPVSGAFSMITGMPAISALNTVGSLVDASRKGAYSTVSSMLGMVSPTAAAITAPINAYATFKGVDVDNMLGLGANQGFMSQTAPSSGNDMTNDNSDSDINNISISAQPGSTSSEMLQINRPDTTPSFLPSSLSRGKRRPGSDVYGVVSGTPFLNYSEDVDISGMGSSSRSGQFKSAPTGR